MSPKLRVNDPPYVQIAASIRADVVSGKLAEGDTIPSARQIAASWGVALATATKVLALLRSEGLVRAQPGIGTVVVASEVGFGGSQRLTMTRERGHVYMSDERAEITSAALVEAPDYVADALGVEHASDVVRRERIIRRGTTPVSASVSWLPGKFVGDAPKLLQTERIREGTFAYVQRTSGLSIDRGRETAAAGAATAEQAAVLGVAVGSPVMLSRTWFYAADGSVVEFGESTQAPGRWSAHDFAVS